MPDLIKVTRSFSAPPLFPITDPTFATWYSHGVFWALYGDEQGKGLYEDTYLIDNIARNLRAGRYDHPASPDLAPSGLYIGMIHGGNLEPGSHRLREADTIVVLTDPDFSAGYQQGQKYPHPLTDFIFMQQLHQFTVQHVMAPALAYELGVIIGTLSHALKPASMPMTSRSGMVYIP